jgi:GNAT superfamily N-acetyltransferase
MSDKQSTEGFSLRIEKASMDDIPEMTRAMTHAFDDDSQRHLGNAKGGPPGYDDGEFFRKWMPPEESVTYKIIVDDQVAGGVIIWDLEGGENILGTIFVDPAFQRQGIGSVALRFIDRAYPETKQWTLGTPSWALSNHRFYERNGFVKISEEEVEDIPGGVSYTFRKVLKPD